MGHQVYNSGNTHEALSQPRRLGQAQSNIIAPLVPSHCGYEDVKSSFRDQFVDSYCFLCYGMDIEPANH